MFKPLTLFRQLAVISLCILMMCSSVCAEDKEPEKWKSADGKYGLVTATPSKVILVKLADHKQFEGNWLKMPLPLRKEIAGFWANQDRQQLAKVQKAFASNQNMAKGLYDDLKRIHLDYPLSPYAGLALGVSYAALMNDAEKSLSVLKQVATRLETQRGANPESHSNTLASCYCDMAVCALKEKKADNGLSYLIRSMDVLPSPIVVHNAHQLALISKSKEAYLKLEEADQTKLAKMLASVPAQQNGYESGWHYSLLIDDPSPTRSHYLSTGSSLLPPADGLQLIDACIGIAVSDRAVVFPDRICTLGISEPLMISYLLPTGNQAIAVNDVSVEVDGVSTQFRSTLTRFRPAPKTSSKKMGLAAFTVERRAFTPSLLSLVEPVDGLESKFFEFDKTQKQNITIKKIERAIKNTNGAKGFEVKDANAFDFLDSPIFGPELQFMGIVVGRGLPSPKIATAGEIRIWLERSARVSIPQSLSGGTLESLVPIVAWTPAKEASSGSALIPGKGELTSVVRDEWCIPCGGKGFFKCPNCLKGVVSYKDAAQTGFNPFTKQPIIGTVVKQRPCEACNAEGAFKCPHCNNGRIGR